MHSFMRSFVDSCVPDVSATLLEGRTVCASQAQALATGAVVAAPPLPSETVPAIPSLPTDMDAAATLKRTAEALANVPTEGTLEVDADSAEPAAKKARTE